MARVPGVLLEQYDKARGCSEYEIEGHFQALAPLPPVETVDEPEAEETQSATPSPVDNRILAAIWTRRGQSDFRSSLLVAYESRCAVTGCDAIEALEAAHIIPFSQDQNYAVSNGILMRADIHTLFDLFLMSIDPSTGILRMAPSLVSAYGKFEGQQVALPSDYVARPAPERLALHFKEWSMRWQLIRDDC